jgi:hypothetical protein
MKYTEIIDEYAKQTWEAQRHYITDGLEYTDEQVVEAAATIGVTASQLKTDTEHREKEFLSWDELPKVVQALWKSFVTSDEIIDVQLVATRQLCEAAMAYQALSS